MTEVGSAPANPEIDSLVTELLDNVELLDVKFAKVSGEILGEADETPTQVELEIQAGYRVVDGQMLCRFNMGVPVKGGGGALVARMDIAVIAAFALAAEFKPDRAAIDAFMQGNAFLVTVPFFREALQSMSIKLDLPAITFGIFRRGREHALRISLRSHDKALPDGHA